jgi:hypothetical protein
LPGLLAVSLFLCALAMAGIDIWASIFDKKPHRGAMVFSGDKGLE